jgi:hypothetical protein
MLSLTVFNGCSDPRSNRGISTITIHPFVMAFRDISNLKKGWVVLMGMTGFDGQHEGHLR